MSDFPIDFALGVIIALCLFIFLFHDNGYQSGYCHAIHGVPLGNDCNVNGQVVKIK